MSPDLKHILAALTGAALQEVIHWYEARGKLQMEEYRSLWKSPAVWAITAAMIVLSALGCWFWYEDTAVHSRDYLITAAAFGAIFKKAVAAASANRRRRLGTEPGKRGPVRVYFEL